MPKERESQKWWFARTLWPLVGGVWGAWVGFQGMLQHSALNMNADTAAPIFVWAFYAFFAVVGLLSGATLAAFVGGSIEWMLRRIGVGIFVAIGVATLVSMLALWQCAEFLQAKYPGLRAEHPDKPQRNKANRAIDPADKISDQKPCLAPPPTDSKQRASWDAECR